MSDYIPFTDEQKLRANNVDLELFLTHQGETLLKSGPEKRLSSDHSVTVRGREWYDHATEEGGGAVSFMRRFYDLSYPEAVTRLLEWDSGAPLQRQATREPPPPPKPFELPEANRDMRRVFAYFTKTRCLDREVVAAFARDKLIYEDAKYHNAVFVGRDVAGIPRHASKRGTYTMGEPYKGNVESSDPKYSFHHTGQSDTVYVFEAPIDLLSYITLHPEGWSQHSYVALCGTAEHALLQLLSDAPQVRKVALCLDSDKAGVQARERLTRILAQRGYEDVSSLWPSQKDWNEDLKELQKPAATLTMTMN